MLSIRCMHIVVKQATPFKTQTRNASRFRLGVQFFFTRNLLLTNILSSGICMVVGDLVQQEYEFIQKQLPKRYDWGRLGRMFTVGMGMGPLHHYYYGYIDQKLPGCNLKTVTKKIILDQTIASPLMIIYFFYTMGILEQNTLSEITTEFKKKCFYVYSRDCMYWPPVQFINFYFLPSQYRVVYINIATMVFNVFLSFVKHYDRPQA